MDRVNFLYAEVKVFPASVEEDHDGRYDWDTILIAKEPVLATYENLFDLYDGYQGELRNAIIKWVNKELLEKGKELIYQNCPTEPEK